MLLRHQDGILNYCHMKVPLGVVEAINDNIEALLRRGRGYRNRKPNSSSLRKQPKMGTSSDSRSEPIIQSPCRPSAVTQNRPMMVTGKTGQ